MVYCSINNTHSKAYEYKAILENITSLLPSLLLRHG